MTQPVNPRQNVTFPSNDGKAHGYLALPTVGPGSGVVVIQEWWGLTGHITTMTDRLAGEGFVALAPDLFGGQTTHDAREAQQFVAAMPLDRAVRDLRGAVDFLLQRPEVTGERVGVVGFCMGGAFALALAALDPARVAAAVAFYGLPPEATDLSALRARVQGHYGVNDPTCPPHAVRPFFARLAADTRADIDLHFYPAGHAFLNEENPQGFYNPEQGRIAWSRTIDFLRSALA